MNFMTPIESPNLPKRGITLAAVSVGAEKAKEYLNAYIDEDVNEILFIIPMEKNKKNEFFLKKGVDKSSQM